MRMPCAETRHARTPPNSGACVGKFAGLLFGNVVANAFAEANEARVFMDRIKTEPRADFLEKIVVGVSHRFGEAHVAAATDVNHGVASDRAFLKSSQSDDRLDRGARFEAGGESHFLIDDGKDASGGGVHREDGTFFMAESVDGNLADDGIVEADHVVFRWIAAIENHASVMRAMRFRLWLRLRTRSARRRRRGHR